MKPKIFLSLSSVYIVFFLNNIVLFSQWCQLTTNISENLQDIYFVNTSTGVAVGFYGKIIRTTDAGQTWFTVTSGTPNALYSLDFPDIMTGFTGGTTGTVLRTLNGGASWLPRTGCGINITSVSFFDVNTGITAGGGILMCFTTDAGQNWNPRYSPSYAVMSAVFITGNTLLIACTDMPGAVIFKSTNTGNNWTTAMQLNNSGLDVTYSLSYIYFKDQMTGFCTGSRTSYGQTLGSLYRSTNGGDNWILTASSGPQTESGLHGVHFSEPNTGFTVGNNGVIMRSTDGGANWSAQSSTTNNSLNAVYMLNALTGYVCGNGGMVLKTTNGGVTGFIKLNEEIPSEYKLYQNYPNPFNPVTKIKFDTPPRSSLKGWGSAIQLVIYDVLGRDVANLIPPLGGGQVGLQPGTYEVEWNASNCPSGVYFYKLITDDHTETRKMVLFK
jgi:photosystem II stability/assembly factor-like uncharacterized protein